MDVPHEHAELWRHAPDRWRQQLGRALLGDLADEPGRDEKRPAWPRAQPHAAGTRQRTWDARRVVLGGAKEGALHAISGDVSIDRGNISISAGEKGVYLGPACAEVKLKKGLKIDGGGDIGVDLQGSYADVDCQFEIHSGCIGILLDRTVNSADCGRSNWVGGRFIGDGTSRAWIARNTGGGGMYGNHLNYPTYSNVLNQAKSEDATVLPDGLVFEDGGDYYRDIVQNTYRDGGSQL